MLQALLDVVIPVFAVAGLGFLYAGRRDFPVAAMTDLIVHLTGACLVLDALSTADRLSLDTLRVPASAVLVVVGGTAVAALAHRLLPPLRSLPVGAVVLPAAFMNAGNMGLPVAQLAFGRPGLEVATLFFVSTAALMYSMGVSIMAGRGGTKVALRLPLLHAAWIGILLNQLEVRLPNVVFIPIHLLGQTVVPLMLLALGARLRELLVSGPWRELPWLSILLLTALRTGGGVSLGLAANALLGNEGVVGHIIFLSGFYPPAVMNFALVEKYGEDPRASAAVSGAIALGAGLALLTLPYAVSLVRG